MDSSVAARILSEKTGIFAFRYQQELALILQAESQNSGESLESTVARALIAWTNYKANMLAFEWRFPSPVGFFRSAIWNDDRLWPWKSDRAAVGAARRGNTAVTMDCEGVYGDRHKFCDQEWCQCQCHTIPSSQ